MRFFVLLPEDLSSTKSNMFDPGVEVQSLKSKDGRDAKGILFAHFVNDQMVHTVEVKDDQGNLITDTPKLLDQLEINYEDGSARILPEVSDLDDFYDVAAIWLPVSNTTKLFFSNIRQLEKTHRVLGLFDSRKQKMAFRSKIITIAANTLITVVAQKVNDETKYLNRIAFDGYQLYTQGEIFQEQKPKMAISIYHKDIDILSIPE